MATDTQKRLERARRSLEKNKLREAVAEYQGVLEEVPSHQEALQALADIYTRLNEPGLAAPYYGLQFERLLEVSDAAKAAAIYTRFLRPFPQPPDRLMRYAALLQRQNRPSEAIEQYSAAAKSFEEQKRDIEALACYESIALLDPENPARHVALGELAERLRHSDLAARSFVRAGQLTQAAGILDQAIEYFEHAHQLAPADRTGALLLGEARLRKGDAEGAVALLDPFSPNEKDTAFLALFGEGLLRIGKLDRACECFQAYYRQKPENFGKLFEVASGYLKQRDEDKAIALVEQTKDWMRSLRKEAELGAHVDKLAEMYPASLRLAEVVAHLYEELNRETKYFDALMKLFDLYLIAGRMREACDALDRLVDIDPYDYRNQERIAQLEGKVDPAFLQNVLARAAKAATVSSRAEGFAGAGTSAGAAAPVTEEGRAQQALEDLIVQVEIFLQYSLQSKAVERLERIAQLFPGEEEKNERLRALYDRANWWPSGSAKPASANGTQAVAKPAPPPAPPPMAVAPAPSAPEPAAPPVSPASAADTHRDLSAIAEINRLMYRQSTPREVLATTAAQVGKHLNAARCLVSVGGSLDGGHLTAEYCAPGISPASVAHVPALMHLVASAPADPLGGVELHSANAPVLKDLGLESALGVVLTDKETQEVAGTLIVGDPDARRWKPNESFFLQAVGDQLVLSVNHTRLRSLVRSLAVADEKTGLLSRGAYLDCLLVEANRSRAQNTRLSLVILHLDHGNEILRQRGDQAVDRYMEQLARALSSTIRQTDIAVKYTVWSLAFILPDTSVDNAKILAEKLKKAAANVRPSWDGKDLTISAIVAEASSRPADETEDRVTEWINRAEYGLDELRQSSGGQLLALATP
ncbi:MAG TPA: diguanylate cyclase [Candidatus Acidoferrales bacterium]|nr:diguanylate cyclase [Candidatus Acidoferrales bacterium]